MSFNGHIGVFGQTGTGKTVLLREYCKLAKSAGFSVLALDNNFDIDPVDWRTDDIYEFIDVLKKSRNCFGIVDEGSQTVRWGDSRISWLGKTSRHFGHRLVFSSQRPVDITLDIRSQCGKIHAFFVLEADAKAISEVSQIPWREIGKLEPFQFITWERFKGIKYQKLKLGVDTTG